MVNLGHLFDYTMKRLLFLQTPYPVSTTDTALSPSVLQNSNTRHSKWSANNSSIMRSIVLSFIAVITTTAFSFGQNCPGYSNSAISAPEACGNQLYYLEVPNTTCNGLIWFDVSGNSGTWGNEISWEVTSNLTTNIVASGGGYGNNQPWFVAVGPLDPAIEGQFFTLTVYDTFGDGFTGGGFCSVDQGATNLAYIDDVGNWNDASQVFAANIDIYSSTITVTTPSGNVNSTATNCADHEVPLTLVNNNFCSPVTINLPWTIVCDGTGATLASGTETITLYPQIPTGSNDLVDVTWNPGTCSWDVSPQNDCVAADIGNVFTISPDPATSAPPACEGGSENFTISYIGVSGGPDCCLTGGPVAPITYNTTNTASDASVLSSPYGGTNNSAYSTIPGNGSGGNATSFNLTVNISGFCYPNPAGTSTDNTWYIAVWVDGVQIILQGPLSGGNGSVTITQADLTAAGVTYNENSVIEVYIIPNLFWQDPCGAPFPCPIYTTYVPGGNCGSLGDGEWTVGTYDVTTAVTFEQMTPTPATCSFVTPSPYTCCTPATVTDDNDAVCSGSGTGTLSTWQTAVSTANPSCLVYSSVTPVPGTTPPDNNLPNGVNGGAAPINQVVSAYAYCDADGSGTDNAGDSYTLLSTYTLTVNPIEDPSFTVTPDCNGGTATITGTGGGTFSFETPPGDGAVIDPNTGTVTNGTPGNTYNIQYVTAGACADSIVVNLTALSQDDPTFTMSPTCDGATATIGGTVGGTFNFDTPPGDGAVIDPNTGTITNGTSGNTYTVEYVTSGPCPDSLVINVTAALTDDPSFSMTPSCVGATVSNVVTPGGTYTFNPAPGDGAVIDPNTGEITNGTAGATYTVEYTTGGTCSATTTVNVTLTLLDDPAFTMTSNCVGATVTSTATPGGTFAFNPAPGDGSVIDPNTGEITNGTAGSTYTVEYTTGGTCSATTTVNVTLTILDDPSFAMAPTCDGGTVSSTATAGGTFAFNTPPGDGAVIDPNTGTVSGGTPGATYDIIYVTGGMCSDSTTQTVTAYALPSAPSAAADATYCSSDIFNDMTAVGTGGTYTWYTDPGLTPPGIGTGPTMQPLEIVGTTTYYVTETVNGCEGPAGMVVIVIEECGIVIPTAFTPDGDLINDDWIIQDLDNVYPNNIVRVYNRWGNMLYESTQGDYASDPWDGTFNGTKLPVGSYYFTIELNDKDSNTEKGTVSIILNK